MLGVILLLQSLVLAVSGPATSPEYLPLRVAESEGYYAREGLNVVVRTTRAEPGAAEALVQGQADLVATSIDAMLRFGPRSVTQGPRVVFGLTAAPPVALLVPTSQAQIVKSLNDLAGTRVGLSSPGAPEHAWFAWLLARAGLTAAQMWVVSYGTRGLVAAVESGDVHSGLVHEPAASRLVADGQASVLVDLRTPAAVAQAIGTPTVNAAVFVRADRRPRDRDLTAFARAVLAAEQRIATASAQELAQRLSQRITTPADEFEARLETTRKIYLPDGLVSPEQIRETLILIRAYQPLPITSRVPPPEEMLHVEPLRRALSAPAGR
ncbi:MAG TPA: ABC transporter substrate-binding protein [Methylomirabilota bacterium]|jgi:NitT/TauT family transport system substrate-binding protein|nr:ABC transporter substrate-binding protein [Methylomirabilota bacterium]